MLMFEGKYCIRPKSNLQELILKELHDSLVGNLAIKLLPYAIEGETIVLLEGIMLQITRFVSKLRFHLLIKPFGLL